MGFGEKREITYAASQWKAIKENIGKCVRGGRVIQVFESAIPMTFLAM